MTCARRAHGGGLGLIVLGIAAGLVAAGWTLATGGSFWLALALYSGIGTLSVAGLLVLAVLREALERRQGPADDTAMEGGNPA